MTTTTTISEQTISAENDVEEYLTNTRGAAFTASQTATPCTAKLPAIRRNTKTLTTAMTAIATLILVNLVVWDFDFVPVTLNCALLQCGKLAIFLSFLLFGTEFIPISGKISAETVSVLLWTGHEQ
jgi:hypothetical protein